MNYKRVFPCVIAACFALSLFAVTVAAQTDIRLRQVTNLTTTTIEPDGVTRLETDPIIISRAAAPATASGTATLRLDGMLMHAIDSRLGSRYVWGAAGPTVFDCSGFVWSTFKEIGADFYRGSARSYWARFAPAREDEKFKFGTLVFFNGLTHVGIVADEKGFYHASRHKGVVYQEWNKYYLSRVDGFRRVPLPAQLLAAAE
ncbi:MAG TPA: NlpC/P60 family protein [Pyrinomonadaceae bacterium]|nr:NlpC/P60 family protein [Pyrinomonadaceae bacterium]